MNSTEQNAIKIAELIGLPTTPSNTFVFEYYDGLMPIVFECNSGISFGITIRPNDIMLHDYSRNKYWFDCNYTKEPKFIEAIQLACIKYLELKNE